MAAKKPARLPSPFAHVIHQETVARLARDVTLAKVRTYAAAGRVLAIALKEMQIVAALQGTAFYAVSLLGRRRRPRLHLLVPLERRRRPLQALRRRRGRLDGARPAALGGRSLSTLSGREDSEPSMSNATPGS